MNKLFSIPLLALLSAAGCAGTKATPPENDMKDGQPSKTMSMPSESGSGMSMPNKGNTMGGMPGMSPTDMKPATMSAAYTCSMHPEVASDKPGVCPKCGMTLVKTESH